MQWANSADYSLHIAAYAPLNFRSGSLRGPIRSRGQTKRNSSKNKELKRAKWLAESKQMIVDGIRWVMFTECSGNKKNNQFTECRPTGYSEHSVKSIPNQNIHSQNIQNKENSEPEHSELVSKHLHGCFRVLASMKAHSRLTDCRFTCEPMPSDLYTKPRHFCSAEFRKVESWRLQKSASNSIHISQFFQFASTGKITRSGSWSKTLGFQNLE